MNGNPLPALIVTCLLAFTACFSILLGEGNVLANLFLYFIIGGSLLAFMSPRAGFLLCIISSGYVDLVKRLMIVSDRVQMLDLYYILGFPPLVFMVSVVSLMLRGFTGTVKVERWHVVMWFLACFISLANGVLSLVGAEGGYGRALQDMANGAYSMMLFAMPLLYARPDDAMKLFRIMLWIYMPVAMYAIAQGLWGFRDFEILYLQSGYTIEVKQLLTDRVRAFSTLNSPTSLGAVSAAMVVLPFMLWRSRRADGHRQLNILEVLMFTPLFAGAMLASTSRSAFIIIIVCVIGSLCFRSRLGTRLFYGFAVLSFAGLIASATYLQDRLADTTESLIAMAGSQVNEEALNVNTFSDRLQGFAMVLSNPEAYTWFGYGPERGTEPTDPLYNHDLLSNILVRYGAVALAGAVMLGVTCLTFGHRQLLAIQDRRQRRIGAMMLALVCGMVAISITSGNVLNIFPVNILFWMAAAAAVIAVRHQPERAKEQPQPSVRGQPSQPMYPMSYHGTPAAGYRPLQPPHRVLSRPHFPNA